MRKPSVILLHGLMGSGATWKPVARSLDDFDVIAPDARGHGASPAPLHGYTYDDHARDVVELIRLRGLSRPALVGHSMGGMTAAVVASRGLVSSLVLVDPTFLSPERQREVHASEVADQHRRLLGMSKTEIIADIAARHPHRSREVVELLAEARLGTALAAFEVLTPPNPDYRELMRAIDVPTLLVLGDNPVVTLAMAAELRELNPRVQTAQIAHAGHGVPFDQPEQLGDVIGAFLRRAS